VEESKEFWVSGIGVCEIILTPTGIRLVCKVVIQTKPDNHISNLSDNFMHLSGTYVWAICSGKKLIVNKRCSWECAADDSGAKPIFISRKKTTTFSVAFLRWFDVVAMIF